MLRTSVTGAKGSFWGLLLLALGLTAFGAGCDDKESPKGDPDSSMGDQDAGDDNDASNGTKDIVDTAVGAGSFTTLVAALQRTGLDEALRADGPFTVFAPTDDAFEALGVNLADLSDDELATILKYHVLAGAVKSTDITGITTPTTLADLSLFINPSSGVKVNGATVTTADIEASNGVIHVIDAVLLPQDILGMATIAGLSGLGTAVGQASGDLDVALAGDGPFTVFAPTNAAFATALEAYPDLTADQLRDVLLYHVVSGSVLSSDLVDGDVATLLDGQSVTVDVQNSGVKVNTANVVYPDIRVTNGVVHVIDAVLVPDL